MGRDRKSKHKLSRREGKDLFGTGGPSLELIGRFSVGNGNVYFLSPCP